MQRVRTSQNKAKRQAKHKARFAASSSREGMVAGGYIQGILCVLRREDNQLRLVVGPEKLVNPVSEDILGQPALFRNLCVTVIERHREGRVRHGAAKARRSQNTSGVICPANKPFELVLSGIN